MVSLVNLPVNEFRIAIMNPGDKDLIKAAAEGSSKGVTDSILMPYHALVGRFCTEVGEAVGYIGTLGRIAVGIKVMKMAEAMLSQIGVDGRPMARSSSSRCLKAPPWRMTKSSKKRGQP
jgi:hypothetical protein